MENRNQEEKTEKRYKEYFKNILKEIEELKSCDGSLVIVWGRKNMKTKMSFQAMDGLSEIEARGLLETFKQDFERGREESKMKGFIGAIMAGRTE